MSNRSGGSSVMDLLRSKLTSSTSRSSSTSPEPKKTRNVCYFETTKTSPFELLPRPSFSKVKSKCNESELTM